MKTTRNTQEKYKARLRRLVRHAIKVEELSFRDDLTPAQKRSLFIANRNLDEAIRDLSTLRDLLKELDRRGWGQ